MTVYDLELIRRGGYYPPAVLAFVILSEAKNLIRRGKWSFTFTVQEGKRIKVRFFGLRLRMTVGCRSQRLVDIYIYQNCLAGGYYPSLRLTNRKNIRFVYIANTAATRRDEGIPPYRRGGFPRR